LIAILDYGSGNIRSAERAFARTGNNVVVTKDSELISRADALVVPGVGAFGACMSGLLSVQGDQIISRHLAAKKPLLGICVGMQILFDSGTENFTDKISLNSNDSLSNDSNAGLGILPGVVSKLQHPRLPHMGWNTVVPPQGSTLFRGVERERFYFVHSYAVPYSAQALSGATITEYGERFIAAVESENICATQFHPEKSGDAGLQLIRNWSDQL
jgi:glutamine amidotransferase